MMTVKAKQFKVGDKVRILDVRKIGGGLRYFKNGDTTHILKVDSDDYPYLYCNDGDYKDGLIIAEDELEGIEVIIEESPSKNERITALETQVAELQAELQTLKKRKKPKHLLSHYPTPNEQRKAVIERAKAFLEKSKTDLSLNRGRGYVIPFAPGEDGGFICDLVFEVNAKKRTVVALFKYQPFDTSVVKARGIAKCAPDDVFNADIGKAIALGRALGMDVSEFENAPKPTEFAVGHKIEYSYLYAPEIHEIVKIYDGKAYVHSGGFHLTKRVNEKGYRITDDTEVQY